MDQRFHYFSFIGAGSYIITLINLLQDSGVLDIKTQKQNTLQNLEIINSSVYLAGSEILFPRGMRAEILLGSALQSISKTFILSSVFAHS